MLHLDLEEGFISQMNEVWADAEMANERTIDPIAL